MDKEGSRDLVLMLLFLSPFLDDRSKPYHVIQCIFETLGTCESAMWLYSWMIIMLPKHGFNIVHVLASIKNERNNLSIMIFALTYVVFCEVLRLATPSIWACWGHTMFKSCQYATNNFKICVNLISISIKERQSILWKTNHLDQEK